MQLSQASLQMTFSVGFDCIMGKLDLNPQHLRTNLSSI